MQAGGLVLHTARADRSAATRAEWRGLSDLTPVLRRSAVSDAVKTVSLLHALCPFAHGVALLRASERAAGLELDEDQDCARDVLCLGDMLSAQVWRGAVSWAKLAGVDPDMAAAGAARTAARDLALALYPAGDWAQPGGGEVWPNAAAVTDALARFDAILTTCRPVVPAIETSALGRFVAKRFAAMAQAPGQTFVRLNAMLPRVRSCPARPLTPAAAGQGAGAARTARGPLAYSVGLSGGRIDWARVSSPSARRFAAQGRFARVAAVYARPGDAALLAAAFDPCADVAIAEAGHA